MNLSSVKTLVFENFKNNVDVYSLYVRDNCVFWYISPTS